MKARIGLLAAATLVAVCTSAHAGVAPEAKCRASKFTAAGKYLAAVFKCSSTAAKLEVAIDESCLSDASSRLSAAFSAADTTAGTPCTGEAAVAETGIDEVFANVVAATGSGSCAATKQKAVGKGGAGIFKAYGKSILKSSSSVESALAKAEDKITTAFSKAGSCGAATADSVFELLHGTIDATAVCLSAEGTCTSVSTTIVPGGEATTDPLDEGATPSNPVTTSIVSPTGGDVTITQAESDLPPPAGYSALGVQVAISAPDASVSDPLAITLRLDASLIPPSPSYVRLTRNGTVVELCTGTPGTAAPDPCEASRTLLPDGDLEITALSSQASVWTQVQGVVTVPPCSLDGTWQTDTGDKYHLEEQAGGLVRSLADRAVQGDGGPLDNLGGDLVRTSASLMSLANYNSGGSVAGSIDATCDNMYFPDLGGAAPILTRIATTYCGDGTVDPGEQCDDGNDVTADSCNPYSADPDIVEIMEPFPPFETVRVFAEYVVTLCVNAPINCGNGVVDAGEQCDDGNMYTHDGCQPDCTATCGNGAIDDDTMLPDLEEACDDGNTDNGDGCSSNCEVEAP